MRMMKTTSEHAPIARPTDSGGGDRQSHAAQTLPSPRATANHLTHSNLSSLCAVRWFPVVNSIQTRCRAFQLTPSSSAAVEVRTVAGPSRALQCVLGGRPRTASGRVCGASVWCGRHHDRGTPGRPQAPDRSRGCARYGNTSAGGRSTSRPSSAPARPAQLQAQGERAAGPSR